jgi:hypothetical protein
MLPVTSPVGTRLEIEGPAIISLPHTETIRRGRPRIEETANTLKARKPWEALGMSRRTWERRRAEKKA